MNPNRPKWTAQANPYEVAKMTESEAVSAFKGSYAYCATVEVHAKEGLILHAVEVDTVPNIVGLSRKRWFTFEGPNRVALRMDPPELTPPVVEATLIWERVQ